MSRDQPHGGLPSSYCRLLKSARSRALRNSKVGATALTIQDIDGVLSRRLEELLPKIIGQLVQTIPNNDGQLICQQIETQSRVDRLETNIETAIGRLVDEQISIKSNLACLLSCAQQTMEHYADIVENTQALNLQEVDTIDLKNSIKEQLDEKTVGMARGQKRPAEAELVPAEKRSVSNVQVTNIHPSTTCTTLPVPLATSTLMPLATSMPSPETTEAYTQGKSLLKPVRALQPTLASTPCVKTVYAFLYISNSPSVLWNIVDQILKDSVVDGSVPSKTPSATSYNPFQNSTHA